MKNVWSSDYMLTIEEACRLVLEKYGGYKYIGGITDTGDTFQMGLLNEKGYSGTDNGFVIDKTTMLIRPYVWTREMLEKTKNGKKVEVPEKYRFTGEIKYD